MVEALLITLIYIAVLALVVWVVIWVLQTLIGWALPARIIQIIWVIFVLIVLLLLLRAMVGHGPFKLGGKVFGGKVLSEVTLTVGGWNGSRA